jgi:predicted esterase
MVLLHGRNAAPENILTLVPRLDRPGVTFLAPAADANSWYPHTFLSEIEKNEPHLSAALAVVERLVQDLLDRGVPRERMILSGFSQGGCLAGEFAVRHAGRYGGLVMLSAGLIGPPGTTWIRPGSFDGTPVFLGCSDVDAHIPRTRVEESAAVFERMGARVTMRLYAGMGHVVNDEEIETARGVIDAALGQGDSP